jgi:hypothetical protein
MSNGSIPSTRNGPSRSSPWIRPRVQISTQQTCCQQRDARPSNIDALCVTPHRNPAPRRSTLPNRSQSVRPPPQPFLLVSSWLERMCPTERRCDSDGARSIARIACRGPRNGTDVNLQQFSRLRGPEQLGLSAVTDETVQEPYVPCLGCALASAKRTPPYGSRAFSLQRQRGSEGRPVAGKPLESGWPVRSHSA